MKNLYQIVDEPKPRAISYLIVPPIVILLAAMFLTPYWAALWLVVNGFLLGSRTFWKEVGVLALGATIAFSYLMALSYLTNAGYFADLPEDALYFKIIFRGICFLFIYWTIFLQNASYEIFKYWQTEKNN